MDIHVGLRYRIAMAVLYYIQLTNAFSFDDQKAQPEPHCYSRFDYEYKVVQKLVALEDSCSHLKTTTDALKTEIDNLKNELNERSDQARDVSSVAFTAVLKPRLKGYAAKTTIVFGDIITNIGNGYNPSDGVFTAPYEGIYQFSATILADNSGEVWCGFMKNGKQFASVYARASDTRHDQGAMTIILQLSKGDTVVVQNYHIASIYGEGYTSFSGHLLR